MTGSGKLPATTTPHSTPPAPGGTPDAGLEGEGRATEGSPASYRSMVEDVPYAIFRKDVEGRYVFGNLRYCERHATTPAELIGKTDYDLYPPELARRYREDDRRAIERGEVLDIEEEHRDPANPDRWRMLHTLKCPIRGERGEVAGVQGISVAVTDWRPGPEDRVDSTSLDALTGLATREGFHERLEAHLVEALAGPGRLAVLLADLDRFREINDAFGHHEGDRILRKLGPRFEAAAGPGDVVARLGGDEFGLVLPGAGRAAAVAVAERLRASLAEPIAVGGAQVEVSASVGLVLCPDHGTDRIALVQHADLAMDVAKRARCGLAIFEPGQAHRRSERLTMMAELRRALGDEQFRLDFQPKIDLATRRPSGAEALIRWSHPRAGLIPPDRFIPLAEQTGLIRGIDLWAACNALAECRGWPEGAVPLTVSVNLATPGLQDPDLVDQFREVLERSNVSPSNLVVEVTEAAMMADPGRARQVLEGLHGMGLALAIDDFGTGYSSLAYLKDLPIDEVKIDRSFVGDMTGREANACVVRAVVDLGHNLGLRVTAEGVEDPATLDILGQLGCDQAQGYYISPPLPPIEFDAWLRRQAPAL